MFCAIDVAVPWVPDYLKTKPWIMPSAFKSLSSFSGSAPQLQVMNLASLVASKTLSPNASGP